MHNIAQYCTTLHNIAQYCTILHNIAQHCTTLHNIAQYCTILHNIARDFVPLVREFRNFARDFVPLVREFRNSSNYDRHADLFSWSNFLIEFVDRISGSNLLINFFRSRSLFVQIPLHFANGYWRVLTSIYIYIYVRLYTSYIQMLYVCMIHIYILHNIYIYTCIYWRR